MLGTNRNRVSMRGVPKSVLPKSEVDRFALYDLRFQQLSNHRLGVVVATLCPWSLEALPENRA